MLHQDLTALELEPFGQQSRWLAPAVGAAAGISGALLLLIFGKPILAGAFLLLCAGAAFAVTRTGEGSTIAAEELPYGPYYSLIGSALALSRDAAALTDPDGGLLLANAAYRDRFGQQLPLSLGQGEEAQKAIETARSMARRHGAGCAAGI